MRTRALLIAVLVALAGFAAGCSLIENTTTGKEGTKTISVTLPDGTVTTRVVPDIPFAKVQFLAHSGLAFGAFYRYVYTPYKQKAFSSGGISRIKAIAKAGAAGAFIVFEIRQARKAALSDDDLRPLADKLDSVLAQAQRVKSGHLGELPALVKQFNEFREESKGYGLPIQKIEAPL